MEHPLERPKKQGGRKSPPKTQNAIAIVAVLAVFAVIAGLMMASPATAEAAPSHETNSGESNEDLFDGVVYHTREELKELKARFPQSRAFNGDKPLMKLRGPGDIARAVVSRHFDLKSDHGKLLVDMLNRQVKRELTSVPKSKPRPRTTTDSNVHLFSRYEFPGYFDSADEDSSVNSDADLKMETWGQAVALFEFSFVDAPIVLQHHLINRERVRMGLLPGYDWIKGNKWVREVLDKDDWKDVLFNSTGDAMKVLQKILLPNSKITKNRFATAAKDFAKYGPGLVILRKLPKDYIDESIHHHYGPSSAPLHDFPATAAAVLFKVKDADTSRPLFLLQTFFPKKQFVEVDADYLASCDAEIYFVKTPQTRFRPEHSEFIGAGVLRFSGINPNEIEKDAPIPPPPETPFDKKEDFPESKGPSEEAKLLFSKFNKEFTEDRMATAAKDFEDLGAGLLVLRNTRADFLDESIIHHYGASSAPTMGEHNAVLIGVKYDENDGRPLFQLDKPCGGARFADADEEYLKSSGAEIYFAKPKK